MPSVMNWRLNMAYQNTFINVHAKNYTYGIFNESAVSRNHSYCREIYKSSLFLWKRWISFRHFFFFFWWSLVCLFFFFVSWCFEYSYLLSICLCVFGICIAVLQDYHPSSLLINMSSFVHYEKSYPKVSIKACVHLIINIWRRFIHTGSNITDSPRISLVSVKVVAEGTSVVKIPCIAEGIPSPVVTWEAVSVRYWCWIVKLCIKRYIWTISNLILLFAGDFKISLCSVFHLMCKYISNEINQPTF